MDWADPKKLKAYQAALILEAYACGVKFSATNWGRPTCPVCGSALHSHGIFLEVDDLLTVIANHINDSEPALNLFDCLEFDCAQARKWFRIEISNYKELPLLKSKAQREINLRRWSGLTKALKMGRISKHSDISSKFTHTLSEMLRQMALDSYTMPPAPQEKALRWRPDKSNNPGKWHFSVNGKTTLCGVSYKSKKKVEFRKNIDLVNCIKCKNRLEWYNNLGEYKNKWLFEQV